MKASHKILVLIPALEEKGNISPLVSSFKKLSLDYGILFIVNTTAENSSKDPTLQEVKKHAKSNKNIYFAQQKGDQGLGKAYKQGVRYAKKNFSFDYLGTMDADGSHRPKYLSRMLKHKDHADLIIASRYIKGGATPGWSNYRRRGSEIVNFLARKLLNTSIQDLTSGFRVYSSEIIKKINLNSLNSRGFVFQIEMLIKSLRNKATFLEIPLTFHPRKKGDSKFRLRDKFEYLFILSPHIIRGLSQKIIQLSAYLWWLMKLGARMSQMKILQFLKRDYFFPYRVMVKINNFCNYRCKTCGIWKNDDKKWLSEKKQEEILKKFGQYIYFLTITGGEPFLKSTKLHNFFQRALNYSPNLKYLSINTNCSKPNAVYNFLNYFLQKKPNLKIYVGLHYIPTKEWAVKNTGRKKAFSMYKKTIKKIRRLQNIYNNRLTPYKLLTISSKEDAKFIKKDPDLWLNFAKTNSFYNNQNMSDIGKLTNKDKLEILNNFLELNQKSLSLLNKRYLQYLKKVLKTDKRKRRCYAGKNRIYINHKGKIYICSRKLQSREEMNNKNCGSCWTPCEANFDINQDFFLR